MMSSPERSVQTIRAKPNKPGFLSLEKKSPVYSAGHADVWSSAAEKGGRGRAMEFCPVCGMLLQIDPGTGSHRLRLFCPVCPYVCPIKNKVHRPVPLPRCNLFCLVAFCRSVAPNRSESDAVPFSFVVPQIVKKARLVKKEVEPIFSTADEMKSAPKTAGELSALLFVAWSYSTLLGLPKYDAFLSLGDCFVIY
jgi:DNA-directed RNA polymerase III subunit RPC11